MFKSTSIQSIERNDKHIEEIANVYCRSFLGEEFTTTDVNQAMETIRKHITYPGFIGVRCVNANDKVIGFTYGYTSSEGQFYRNKLEKLLTDDEKTIWLSNCFEFVELAVDSSHRKGGIGRTLHDALLDLVKKDTSILTTSVDNIPAIRLYQSKNWQIIRDSAVVIEGVTPQVIMVKKLADNQCE